MIDKEKIEKRLDEIEERKPKLNDLVEEIVNFILEKFEEETKYRLEDAMIFDSVEHYLRKDEGFDNAMKIVKEEIEEEIDLDYIR